MVLGVASGEESMVERPTCIEGWGDCERKETMTLSSELPLAFWHFWEMGCKQYANNRCLLLHGPHSLGLNLVINSMQSVCSRKWPYWSSSPFKGSMLLPPALTRTPHLSYFSESLSFFITGSLFWALFQTSSILFLLASTDKVLAPFL